MEANILYCNIEVYILDYNKLNKVILSDSSKFFKIL